MNNFITICDKCSSKETRIDSDGVVCCNECGSYNITPLALPE